MTEAVAPRSSETLALADRLLALTMSSWALQGVYAAVGLGLPEHLAQGPRTSAELAAATGAHEPSLYRLLRGLATLEICRERDGRSFELAPLGRLLMADAPGSLRAWILYNGGPQWRIWGHLLESVRTGQSARKLLMGTDGLDHLEQDAAVAALFNQTMTELTRLAAPAVVAAYDFSGLRHIVDVGGGHAELLAAILAASPDATGVVFDRPHAEAGARRHLEATGLAGRGEFVAGSFFEAVPAGADLYVLKSIIHDWDDERSGVILANCRRAMLTHAKLLVIDRVMPERLEGSLEHQLLARSDLNMLIGPGGRERTESEFRALLAASGFELRRILTAGLTQSLIEAVPAA